MKTQVASTVAVAAFVAILATAPASASGRQTQATSASPAPATPQTINLMCEGTRSVVTHVPIAGTQRREVPVSFMLRIDTAASIAAIMNPNGSRALRAGRYPANRVDGNVVIVVPYVDANNNPQTFTLTVAADGAFSGESTRTEVPNPMEGIGAVLGVDPSAFRPQITSITTGMCWER